MVFNRRSLCVCLAAIAFAPIGARAASVRVGGRSVYVPDGWSTLETSATHLLAASPDQTTYLVVDERATPVTGLAEVNAADFLLDNLQDVRLTSDRMHETHGEMVRGLTGTGTDEGQPQVFWFRLAGGKTKLVTALIYLPASGIQTVPPSLIERILESISAG